MKAFASSIGLFAVAGMLMVLGQPATVRADEQPHLRAAQRHLWVAALLLDDVNKDTGGHREKAIALIYAALEEVSFGVMSGKDHKKAGDQLPPPGQAKDGQQHMHRAEEQLESAEKTLETGGEDKGGHRKNALVLIDEALLEVQDAIEYLRRPPCSFPSKGCKQRP